MPDINDQPAADGSVPAPEAGSQVLGFQDDRFRLIAWELQNELDRPVDTQNEFIK